MPDFRSDKMETREGRGIAKGAWDASSKAIGRALLVPITPALRRYSINKVVDLIGFWTVWHLHGGFDGMLKLGMSERTIYRQIAFFRMAYGRHPDEYVFPGISLDPAAYLSAGPHPKQPDEG